MNTVDAINMSSRLVYIILVPVIRELAGVLLAVAISKDCKARDNGSGALWGVFTLITPLLSGIIYCIYSRFLTKRDAKTQKDKRMAKASIRLTVCAVITYIIALIIAVSAIITGVASGIASSINF